MILEFFFSALQIILSGIAYVLPDYETLPLPDGYSDFIYNICCFFVELYATPIFGIFASYLTGFFFAVVALFFIVNRGLAILNFIRGSGKISL